MTLTRIAERLPMSAAGHVSCLLCRKPNCQEPAQDGHSENQWF
jgi:hypothetical protein